MIKKTGEEISFCSEGRRREKMISANKDGY